MDANGRWVIYCEEKPLESRRPISEQELQYLTRRDRGGWLGVLALAVSTVMAAAGAFALNAAWLMVVATACVASAMLLVRDLIRDSRAIRRAGRESEVLVFASQDPDEEPLTLVFPPGIQLPDMEDEHATMGATMNLYRLAAPPDDLLLTKPEQRRMLPAERAELQELVVAKSRLNRRKLLGGSFCTAVVVAAAWNSDWLWARLLSLAAVIPWVRAAWAFYASTTALRMDAVEGMVDGWVADYNLDPSVTWWMESLRHSREPWTGDGIPHPWRCVTKLTALPARGESEAAS